MVSVGGHTSAHIFGNIGDSMVILTHDWPIKIHRSSASVLRGERIEAIQAAQ